MPRKSTSPPVLEIRLLGPFRVAVGGVSVEEKAWTRRKAKQLVKLLALHPHHRMHREQLMEALWPEQDPDSAADGLYKALYVARKALGPGGVGAKLILTEGQQVVLGSPAGFRVDAEEFERSALAALASGEVAKAEEALAFYAGDLLVEDPYEDWVTGRREQLRTLRTQLLGEIARADESAGRHDRAAERLRDLVAADPVNEKAHRRLMRLYAATGQRHLALRQYQLCCEALRRELDAEPERATVALHERVLAGEIPRASAAPVPAAVPAAAPAAPPVAAPAPALPPTNLPRPITSFVGRSRAVADVRRALEVSRLVTLLGPGGVGKTRLALAAAAEALSEFPDGVWFVDLTPARDDREVLGAVAAAVGARETAGQSVADAVLRALSDRRALLVIDNCEQAVEPSAVLVEELLRRCVSLRALATSREALGVAGEAVWRVPPLSLPREQAGDAVETLLEFEATRLFLDRVRLADAHFDVTPANAPVIARVCRRLDGIPLAIELAAACARAFAVEQIDARLDDRFRLLTGGARTALPRHRTLRAAVDWSYDLLTEEERAFLRRLSVFEGGWDLEDAERVASGGPLATLDVLDLLPRLVDKSLVVVDRRDGETRYRLLETIRQYAAEKLREAGEEEGAGAAHAAWFLDLAEAADAQRLGPSYAAWLVRLETEHDNLRAALRRSLEAPERSEVALRLAAALGYFWNLRGHWSEGRRWLDAALDAAPSAPERLRAKALDAAGSLAQRQGDLERARELYEAGLAIGRDEERVAVLCHNLAIVSRDLGDYERAGALYERSLALHRARGNRLHVATSLNGLGVIATDRGDLDRAREYFAESAAILEELGNMRGAGACLHNLGEIAVRAGDFEAGARYLERSLAVAREHDFKDLAADTIGALGSLAARCGEYERAEGHYRESIEIFRALGAKSGLAAALEGLAQTAAARGDAARALCLEGAAAALREATGWSLPPAEREALGAALGPARVALGKAASVAAYARGRAMSFEEAAAFARGEG